MKVKKIKILFLCAFLLTNCQLERINLKIEKVFCENKINPIGIDVENPSLSWRLKSDLRNKKQTAYKVLVADSPELLDENIGNYWNSGKVYSTQSIQVKYSGRDLNSEKILYWKVKAWDENDDSTDWSATANWEMGLISHENWIADWIYDGKAELQNIEAFYEEDPAPQFRHEFKVDKEIEKARLYISGIGYYEATINGIRVGENVLDPGWTNYKKRVLYSTYDITDQLEIGNNCIGVILGNGWFNPLPMRMWGYLNLREHLPVGRPQLIAQIKITFKDGSYETIASNKNWKNFESPILRNNIYLGETYDARREIENWDHAGFNDSVWKQSKVSPHKLGELKSQNQPPIQITERIKPLKITEPKSGTYIYDFGQNFAGWVELKASGKLGDSILIRYGELLNDDGTLNVMTSVAGQIKGRRDDGNIRALNQPDTAWQSDTYILKGKGEENYIPKFTFRGFRYVEITGYPGKPTLKDVIGLRLNSNLKKVGRFECSNELFNNIQKMVERTFMSNVFSVQSDCPHREKFGYGGDIAVTTDAFIYNYEMSNFYQKVIRDFQEAAHENGMFTDTAPFVGIEFCGLGWAMAHPLLMLELYKYYGNKSIIEEQYPFAKKWFDLFNSKNDLIVKEGLSDHESLTPIPPEEMVTPLYFYTSLVMSELADIVGFAEDEERYKNLAYEISEKYNQKFVSMINGKVSPNTQGSQSFALYSPIIPHEAKKNVLNELLKKVSEKNNHLTTGIFGTKYLLDILSQNGYAAKIDTIVNQKTFPGWGYMLESGATTLWEHWEFSDNTYSHNHPMFGSVSEWFYKWVAGIQIDSNAVGFDKIIIRPQIIPSVEWVKGKHTITQGDIISEWIITEGKIEMKINIPVNCSAKIYIPGNNFEDISENGKQISKIREISLLEEEKNYVVVKVGSGNYLFNSSIMQGP